MPQPIDFYFWPTPNGWKIAIALEEMGLPYDTHLIDISAGDQFAPDFLLLSPNNRMPPTARRSRSLKAARSCNIWPAKPAASAGKLRATKSPSPNG